MHEVYKSIDAYSAIYLLQNFKQGVGIKDYKRKENKKQFPRANKVYIYTWLVTLFVLLLDAIATNCSTIYFSKQINKLNKSKMRHIDS